MAGGADKTIVKRARLAARAVRLRLADIAHALRGRSAELLPPPTAVDEIGGHDFAAIGRHLADIAIDLGALAPDGTIVDIGCGYGRLAVPLAKHLQRGRYRGFDVSRGAIAWCNRWIVPRHPHCEFVRVDVRNGHYNSRGAIAAEEFVFPYEARSADVVFASSLFTHVQEGALRQYITEAARILRPGGRLVASFFLLDDVSRKAVAERRGEPKFVVLDENVAVQDPSDPEAAIAYSETLV
ncbi:MAG TPA: class I SAM-dependent methyltransferase, partial [Thermoanaerobaculia bacterium]